MNAAEFEAFFTPTVPLNSAGELGPTEKLDPANELPLEEENPEETAQQRRLAEERRQLEEERQKFEAERREWEETRRRMEEQRRLETRTPSAPPAPVSERNADIGFFGQPSHSRQTSHSHSWPPRGVNSSLPDYPAYSRDPSIPSCSSDNLQASAPPIEWSEEDGGDKFTPVKKPAAVEFFDDGWERRKVVSSVLPVMSGYKDVYIEPGTALWHVYIKPEPPAPKKSFVDRFLSFGKEEPLPKKEPSTPHCGINPSAPQNPFLFTFIKCSVESAFKATLDAIFEQKLPAFFTPAVIQEVQKNYRLYCSPARDRISELMTHLPSHYRIESSAIRWIYILSNPANAIKDWKLLYGGHTDLIRLHTLIDIFEKLQIPEFSRLNQTSKIFYTNLLSALTSRVVSNDNFEEMRCLAYREAIKTLSKCDQHYGINSTLSFSLSSTT